MDFRAKTTNLPLKVSKSSDSMYACNQTQLHLAPSEPTMTNSKWTAQTGHNAGPLIPYIINSILNAKANPSVRMVFMSAAKLLQSKESVSPSILFTCSFVVNCFFNTVTHVRLVIFCRNKGSRGPLFGFSFIFRPLPNPRRRPLRSVQILLGQGYQSKRCRCRSGCFHRSQ